MSNLYSPRLLLATVLGIGGLGQSHVLAEADALMTAQASSNFPLSADEWSFWPSEEDPAPRQTSSGSTRNLTCSSNDLTPLIPPEQVGRTGKVRPEILLYVPAAVPRQAVFVIQAVDDFYHAVPLRLPETTGIVSVPLPAEIPDLIAGQQYQWSFVFICHDEIRPDSPIVSGWIDTQDSLDSAATDVSSLAQAARYRDNALWYDMISMLAELKLGHPEDDAVHHAWLNVLERHHLEDLASEPIVR